MVKKTIELDNIWGQQDLIFVNFGDRTMREVQNLLHPKNMNFYFTKFFVKFVKNNLILLKLVVKFKYVPLKSQFHFQKAKKLVKHKKNNKRN